MSRMTREEAAEYNDPSSWCRGCGCTIDRKNLACGCDETPMARIADACEDISRPDGDEACGECASCKSAWRAPTVGPHEVAVVELGGVTIVGRKGHEVTKGLRALAAAMRSEGSR